AAGVWAGRVGGSTRNAGVGGGGFRGGGDAGIELSWRSGREAGIASRRSGALGRDADDSEDHLARQRLDLVRSALSAAPVLPQDAGSLFRTWAARIRTPRRLARPPPPPPGPPCGRSFSALCGLSISSGVVLSRDCGRGGLPMVVLPQPS